MTPQFATTHWSQVLAAGDSRGSVLPDPAQVPPGCAFHPRCPLAQERCRVERPRLRSVAADHTVACHFAEDALAAWGASVS